MSDERDRRVKELFERVLDAPVAERDAILGAASDSVQGDVRELIRAESELGDFLETPASQRLFGAPPAETTLAPGDEIAAFKVIAVLGRGGGGVVYEAEQREPKRRVALKLIRARSRSGDALRAFRDEAANLARLQHAAIAHVYAAGVRESAEGAQPWIAMERVGGARSIVRHVREEGLGRDGALRLFLVVCEALHHAHENGVVHRDVTPGNVLVDSDGRPKVVDFGVACGAADAAERAADAVGTLAYASPEQLTRDRGGADRRADVYGLGALLYELLTGTVPHDVAEMSVDEAARAKREAALVPPSARTPGIPRDLDAIVLRCLAPAPESRYGSAALLAADVERFLAGEPVAAYAGGAWYQLGKFVRRRRAAALALAGVAAAVVVGAGVSLWFAVENAAARDLAERRSYAAEIAAAASALRLGDVAELRRRLDRAPASLRDWEWRHLASRIDVSRETVRFGERELWSGSVSADGTLLAVAGLDRSASEGTRFAALARSDGTIVREWTAPGRDVPSAAISADGRRFAAGFADGRVVLHDVAAGGDLTPVAPHAARVIAVTFSPDGARFATACADGTARLWSASDGAVLRELERHPDRVICLAFDPSGARLVTGCRDGSIRVWDAATGALVRRLDGHEASVEGVSVSPDGARLASVSRDQTVRLWNLADGGVIAVGRSHSSNVRGVAFDPLGGSYVSASWDGTLRVWDARTGAETGLLRGHGAAVTAAEFTRGTPRLVSFSWDGTVKRWDPERTDVATCRAVGDQVDALAFDAEGAQVAAAGHDGTLSILDARTARRTSHVQAGEAIQQMEFLGPRSLVLLTKAPEIQVWDLSPAGAQPVRRMKIPLGGPCYMSMRVDAAGEVAWLAEGSGSQKLTCVDLRTGAERATRASPVDANAIACDLRGAVVVGGRDGTIALCTPAGVWTTARPDARAIRSVAFDAEGRRIVAASEGGSARVLRASDLATLLVLDGHSGDVYQAEFLPGGRRIVTASRDHTVRLWDAGDGSNVLVLNEHGYPVTCLAVSRDGTQIATAAGTWGDEQTTVKVWVAPASPR